MKASSAGKAITALLKHGFAEERETNDPTAVHRTDGDTRYGVFVTATGLTSVGIESDAGDVSAATPPEARQFDRPTDLAGIFSQFFCPHCGTTVYMRGTKNPTMTGVPIGLFDDPHSMQPIRSVWEVSGHAWVEITTAVQHFARARVD